MIDYPRTYFGWSATSPADYADPKKGLVIHYNGDATGLDDHADCVAYWKGVRNSHVNGNGWADGGYSFGASVDGDIFEMRGVRRYQAAQGTTVGNRDYYSVSLMIGGAERPTNAQIDAVRRLRKWLMDQYGMAGTVLGHRDFISTSCPGAPLYALVKDGTFTKAPGSTGGGLEDDLIGLKQGDGQGDGKKEQVIALQRIITFSGFDPGVVDGHWGAKTASALLELRRSVGSSVTDASSITGTAYSHLFQALSRAEARKLIAANPGPGGGGEGGTDPQALVGATITSKITGVQ